MMHLCLSSSLQLLIFYLIKKLFSFLSCNSKHIPLLFLIKLKIYGKEVLPDSNLDCYPYIKLYSRLHFTGKHNTFFNFVFSMYLHFYISPTILFLLLMAVSIFILLLSVF